MLESWSSIRRLRGGAGAGDGMTTSSLSARRAVETGSSVLQTVWKHPWVQAMWAWTLMLWRTCLAEFQCLSANQKRLMLAVFFVGIQLGRSLSSLSWKRFKEAVDIPSNYFGPTAPCLSGRVVSVSDGDTLRFYHVPTIFHKSSLKKKQKVSEWALPIRVCTIDTPETSKFGKPGQPFGEDAKKELQKLVDNRIVQVRLLTKDQYGRAVGQVFVPRRLSSLFRRQCVDEVLLQAGLAEVYQGAGAVYGPKGKDEYLKLEEEARKAKKGIWSLKKRESAAEYKRRTTKQ